MRLTVNGEDRDVPVGTTVADVVGEARRGVAVAVNRCVVSRPAWPSAPLHDGDLVEILEARQGG